MSTKKTNSKETFNFEASIQALESIVTKLEAGDLSLEESLKSFEQGINLTRECQQHLAEAEQKVSLLVGEGEKLQTVDFDDESA